MSVNVWTCNADHDRANRFAPCHCPRRPITGRLGTVQAAATSAAVQGGQSWQSARMVPLRSQAGLSGVMPVQPGQSSGLLGCPEPRRSLIVRSGEGCPDLSPARTSMSLLCESPPTEPKCSLAVRCTWGCPFPAESRLRGPLRALAQHCHATRSLGPVALTERQPGAYSTLCGPLPCKPLQGAAVCSFACAPDSLTVRCPGCCPNLSGAYSFRGKRALLVTCRPVNRVRPASLYAGRALARCEARLYQSMTANPSRAQQPLAPSLYGARGPARSDELLSGVCQATFWTAIHPPWASFHRLARDCPKWCRSRLAWS